MPYSSFLCDDWYGNTDCLVALDLALPTKVRTLIHEEISLFVVPYFRFRGGPMMSVLAQLEMLLAVHLAGISYIRWLFGDAGI